MAEAPREGCPERQLAPHRDRASSIDDGTTLDAMVGLKLPVLAIEGERQVRPEFRGAALEPAVQVQRDRTPERPRLCNRGIVGE